MGEQRPGVALEVRGDGVHVAALALGDAGRGGEPLGVAEPGRDVDLGAQLVAEQREGGVPEGEGRVERDALASAGTGAGAQPEQRRAPGSTPRPRRGRGQAQSVGVATRHESRVSHRLD